MPGRDAGGDPGPVADVVVAIDVGGTNLRVALLDRRMSMTRRHQEPSGSSADPQTVVARVRAVVAGMAEQGLARVLGAGFSLAGILDPGEGVVHQCPNLSPHWRGFHLRDSMEQALGVPVVIGNDAKLAAVAEAAAQAPEARCVLYMTISTGIGGGVVYKGAPFLGSSGLGPEVGHIVVMADGPPCGCGSRGCLEALASGTAIAREARQVAQREPSGTMALLARQGHALDAREVQEAALQGDAAARGLLEQAGHYLGLGLVSLAHVLSPDLIVLGGGVTRAGDLVLGPARRTFAAHAMPAYQAGVRIVPAALGDDSSLVGAALAAWQRMGHRRVGHGPSTSANLSLRGGPP